MRKLLTFWTSLRGRTKLFVAGASVLVGLFLFFVFTIEAVHYTESTEFCSTCHTVMEPEIATHAVSAHADIDCGECHVGSGAASKIKYKMSGVRYLWTLPLNLYSRPLSSARDTMRSTEEICESCHDLDYPNASRLVLKNQYGTDEGNTPRQILFGAKIDDRKDELVANSTGPHWHVDNPVYFVAEDDFRQEIPWVQVELDGELVEFVEAGADPSSWEGAEIHTLDCIDCHSREGHTVENPAVSVDAAISRGAIPADLPFIKSRAVDVLNRVYSSDEEAQTAIAGAVRGFFAADSEAVYNARIQEIDATVDALLDIYEVTQFPHMKVRWDTYPLNTGHKDFPGCFRCHDGSHVSDAGEVISPSCRLCHTIPQSVSPDAPLEIKSIAKGPAPDFHENSLWLSEHRFRFDETCAECHTLDNPGGNDNSSSCSSSTCHAGDWRYLELDSPEVVALVAPERRVSSRKLPRIPHPVVEAMTCQQCHGPDTFFAFPDDHEEYRSEECSDCHLTETGVQLVGQVDGELEMTAAAALVVSQSSPMVSQIPYVNHLVSGNENCLACHALSSSIEPVSVTHLGFTNEMCADCHLLPPVARSFQIEAPTATPEPTPPPTSTPEATATAAATTAATTAATSATDTGPTLTPEAEADADDESNLLIVSHPVAGYEVCAACHAVTSDISPAPLDHTGYTDDTCSACHSEP